ncbi:MAG: response regulator transcription factor [Bacteroidota bacterium]
MNPSQLLIVEDQVMTIRILEAYLTEWGYEISCKARTLEEALNQVAAHPPDLALLDINLGKGQERAGIELAQRFRQHHHFPIIFLTGQPEMQVMREAQATRPDAYLTKPINEASLAFAIDDALQKASDRLIHPQAFPEPDLPTPVAEHRSWLLEEFLFVKKGNSYRKLAVKDILWIRADRQYLNIHTLQDTYLLSTNLANFSRQFEHSSLLRISRSHIINIHHIQGFEENHTILVEGQAIPIGKTYREEVQKRFRFLKTTR